jgi:hypothetical protein
MDGFRVAGSGGIFGNGKILKRGTLGEFDLDGELSDINVQPRTLRRPYGTRDSGGGAYPTLKRGANKLRAYGAAHLCV